MSEDGKRSPHERRLLAEEAQLWRRVTETVTPSDIRRAERDAETFESLMQDADVPLVTRPVTPVLPSWSPVQPASTGRTGPPDLGTFNARQTRQISRGHVEIDAVLDLHGHRQDEARLALRRFLVVSQVRGARYVTVITGKGLRERGHRAREWGESEPGVLRRVVREWLEEPEFRSFVVSYTSASRSHGGDGALFVHVRRANRPTK